MALNFRQSLSEFERNARQASRHRAVSQLRQAARLAPRYFDAIKMLQLKIHDAKENVDSDESLPLNTFRSH